MKITKDKIRTIVKEAIDQGEKGDVKRIGKKLERVAGLEQLLSTINSRVEFEQFIKKVIRISSKNVKHNDIILGIKNVKRALDNEKK